MQDLHNPNWEFEHDIYFDEILAKYLHRGILGFDLRCEDTLEAILRKDERILDILRELAIQRNELAIINQFNLDMRYLFNHVFYKLDDLIKLQEHCEITINSDLSSEHQVFVARECLEKVKKEITIKTAAKVKKEAIRSRRKEFQSKRNQLLLQLIARDLQVCSYCGSAEKLHIDHITALSKGGSDELANLQFLCSKCNLSKHDK